MEILNVSHNMRFPTLMTEMLGSLVYVGYYVLIFAMKLPAPAVHRGSHLCPMDPHVHLWAGMKWEALQVFYLILQLRKHILTREPGQRCSKAGRIWHQWRSHWSWCSWGMVPSLSFVPLSSEILLASHGQQLTCVFVFLEVSWTMGSRKPWRKVCSGKWTLTLCAWLRVLSPDKLLLICLGLSLSHVHSLLPSATLHLWMFAPKYLIPVSGYYWFL